MPRTPPIKEKTGETEGERFTSKDLNRKQILLYIFEDFFKGFYILGCLFLDALVVTYFYMEPFLKQNEASFPHIFGLSILTLLILGASFVIDVFLIRYEIRFYLKLFGDDAIKRRYSRKKAEEDREKESLR